MREEMVLTKQGLNSLLPTRSAAKCVTANNDLMPLLGKLSELRICSLEAVITQFLVVLGRQEELRWCEL